MNRRPITGLAGAIAAILLSGCAQQGDFGRPARSTWNTLVDATGAIAAGKRGEPASDFPLTDDERLLRDRAWRFLMPAEDRNVFDAMLANLTRARVLPATWRVREPQAYHDGLVATAFRSQHSRYRRLSEDAAADGRLLPPFAANAAQVIEADALRLRVLPLATAVDASDIANADMRVAENRCLIAWVRLESGLRVAGYRYALEHLVIEMPAREGVATERTIAFFDSRRAVLDPLVPADAEARCGLLSEPVSGLASPVVAKY